MRQLGDAADAEDVRRALERVRGALGIAQQFGLRGIGDPALKRLRDFGRLRRRVVQEGVDQRGVDVTGDVESQVGRFERFRRGLLGLVERGADAARGGEFRRAAPSTPHHRAAAAPSRRRNGRSAIRSDLALWHRAGAPRAAAPSR